MPPSIENCRGQKRTRAARPTSVGDDPAISIAADSTDENTRPTSQPNVMMTITWHRGVLGLAWYTVATAEMQVLQVQDDAHGPQPFHTLRLVFLQAQPDLIYVPSTMDATVLAHLNVDDQPDNNHLFDVRKERAGLFSIERATTALQHVYIRSIAHLPQHQQRLVCLSGLINLSHAAQVCAAGALLVIVQRAGLLPRGRVSRGLHLGGDDGQGCAVGMLESLTEAQLQGQLLVDTATLHALQIFSTEHHPSAMGIGTAKEGLSVFGLLNKCVTPMGRRLLRTWFVRITADVQVIQQRQEAIQWLLCQPDVMVEVHALLKQVKDVCQVVRGRLMPSQGVCSAAEYRSVLASLDAMLQVQQLLQQHLDSSIPVLLQGVFNRVGDPLEACQQLLGRVLDVAQLAPVMHGVEGTVAVMEGVCVELDDLRATYETLPDVLTEVVQRELERVPRYLRPQHDQTQLWSCLYMPQLGFVMRLEGQPLSTSLAASMPDYKLAFEGVVEGREAWFYRCQATQQLDEEYGDMLHTMRDVERSVLGQLITALQDWLPALTAATHAMAQLDCLLSFAHAAQQHQLTCPTVTTDNVLHVIGARDMLTEALVEQYIPNDAVCQTHAGRIKLITGPNSSGKSSYIRAVATIVHLAHIGSFVPAHSATIGLTDRIIARMATPVLHSSSATYHSTFSADLAHVAVMLRHATARSLCLLDEFGKGTLAADGIGLLAGCLTHWAAQGADHCPKVLACTHFLELAARDDVLPRSDLIERVTMDVVLQGNDPVFLFRAVPGCASASFGLRCARLAGLDAAVVERAEEVLQQRRERGIPQTAALPAQAARIKQQLQVLVQLVQVEHVEELRRGLGGRG